MAQSSLAPFVAAGLLATGLLLSLPARAALYEELGGQDGIARIVTGALRRFLADPVIAPVFDNANTERLNRLLQVKFCAIAGGPCVYKGQTMAAAHHGLDIGQAQFNALAEDLQDAMEEQNVSYHTQNRFLALLAPLEREIVSR